LASLVCLFVTVKERLSTAGRALQNLKLGQVLVSRLIGQVRSCTHLSGDAIYRYESSKVLNHVMRDYQPIWRIRSWMSPL
jgi:hypothetical protein